MPGGLSAWSYAQSRGKAMYTTVNTSTFYLLYFSDIKIRKSAIAQFIAFRLDLHLTLQTRCTWARTSAPPPSSPMTTATTGRWSTTTSKPCGSRLVLGLLGIQQSQQTSTQGWKSHIEFLKSFLGHKEKRTNRHIIFIRLTKLPQCCPDSLQVCTTTEESTPLGETQIGQK